MASHKGDAVEYHSRRISEEKLERLEKLDSPIPKALLEDAEFVTEQGNVITKDGVVVSTQDDDRKDAPLGSKHNIFSDPEVKAYYIDVYEKANYECRHVFDAELTWTVEEEKKLVRKLDLRGMCQVLPKKN